MRVAFFGGSFDPPHNGHLAVARAARAAFALDTVLFAPVGMQPLKPEGPAASFADRVAMTRLAIAGEPGFQVSLADAPKPADDRNSAPSYTPNYTIDTLARLRTSLTPDGALFCLMGADSIFGLRRWHRAAELPFVAPLIVASRPGQPLQNLQVDLKAALPIGLTLESAQDESRNESGIEVRTFILINQAGDRTPFYVLPSLHVEISASEIRAQIHAAPGSPTTEPDLVPPAVREYIAQHGLYRS
ncbi:MAG: nicotinate (nicotinamide) nucleotide adenylyltransferase [Terracidiphilus sp.]|nr:nicotinate (nicotinamide) nucleotide adenylyltransferase [Terracidiphilus sp.]